MILLGNINAIPFRRRFGGGGGTPFPYIPGMIARYSGAGLTNEDMSTNPVWKDLIGNGHDLQMKNFAWGGMSGVGGIPTDRGKYEFTLDDYYMMAVSSGTQHAQFTFKVTGLVDGNTLSLADTSSPSNVYGKWTQDGIYTVDIDVINTDRSLYFYNGVSATRGEFTIEILPLYPGALVFDGVDDYGTCDNFPVLTKEKGYTVVALRQWITRGEIAQGLVSNVKNWLKDGAFLLEYRNIQADHLNKPISFGAIGSEMDLPHILTYQTSKSYNGVSITTGNFEGTDVLHVGKLAPTNVETCINAAIWELVFLDHDATEEELTKIKDYFVKTYPWLFPDQAWTVTGKTNEDEDRATIANITGNGNNLVLSNFGFAEGSGYNEEGEYAGYLVTDGVDDKVQDSSFKLNKDWTLVGEWVLLNQKTANAGITKPFSFVIYNRTTGLSLFINTGVSGITIENVKSIKAICSDGRIYLDDWSEMLINKDQNITSSISVLSIGFNGTAYTQIALKNLGIYNDQLFSKDDCIKAYNYLQTLKAK